jgi:hypothetical protein
VKYVASKNYQQYDESTEKSNVRFIERNFSRLGYKYILNKTKVRMYFDNYFIKQDFYREESEYRFCFYPVGPVIRDGIVIPLNTRLVAEIFSFSYDK